jgi:uncharacterized phage protein gp47/JayE
MLDSTGFKRKRFDDLFGDMEDKAKEVFGDKVNTSELSVLGIILRLMAWFLSLAWELAEKVYYSGYVNTAEGVSLDRLGPYVGITRNLALYAAGYVQVTGAAGYIIPAGTLFATTDDIQFETQVDTEIPSSGTVLVEVEAMEAGLIGNVPDAAVSVIVNPVPELTAVTNPDEISGGRNKETDAEYQDRFALSVAGGGAATVDAIRGALLRVPGVRAATVIENISMETDSAGRPPKSFQAYVLGGSSSAIGQAIFSTKAAGIETYGAVSVPVVDLAGNNHVVKYSIAANVSVYLRVNIYKSAAFPADGVTQARTALVRFIGGEDADGTVYAGLTMGADVVRAQLIKVLTSLTGVEDVEVELSTNGSTWNMSNIIVATPEVAQVEASRIEVTVHDFVG